MVNKKEKINKCVEDVVVLGAVTQDYEIYGNRYKVCDFVNDFFLNLKNIPENKLGLFDIFMNPRKYKREKDIQFIKNHAKDVARWLDAFISITIYKQQMYAKQIDKKKEVIKKDKKNNKPLKHKKSKMKTIRL
jgi:hypothetical protein